MKNYVDYYVHFNELKKEINKAAVEDPAELVSQMERLYINIIDSIAEFIINAAPGNKALMLAGPSSSGKTTTAAKLCESINRKGIHAIRISLDDFYLDREHTPVDEFGNPDFECVESLDVPLMKECVRKMMTEGECVLPRFDFKKKMRTDGEYIKLSGNNIVIIEGMHALNPQITNCLPDEKTLKVYCSVKQGILSSPTRYFITPHELRLTRRIVRDSQFRNSTAEQTMNMWPSVRRGEIKYIHPNKGFADITINSVHIYEPCVLAPKALPLLYELDPDSENGREAAPLIEKLRKFNVIDEELVPNTSLLREFLGGGVYN